MTDLRLVFGDPAGDHGTFPLGAPGEHGTCPGAPSAVVGGRAFRTRGAGVEALALAHLRADLLDLVAYADGAVRFADHDEALAVSLRREGDAVALTVDVAAADVWEQPLPPLSFAAIRALVAVVDEAERRWGSLVGHCGCGAPPRSFYRRGAVS